MDEACSGEVEDWEAPFAERGVWGHTPASRVCGAGEATRGQPAGAVPALWDSVAGSRPGNRRPAGEARAAGELGRRRRRREPARTKPVPRCSRCRQMWLRAGGGDLERQGLDRRAGQQAVLGEWAGSPPPPPTDDAPACRGATWLLGVPAATWLAGVGPGLPEEGVEPPHGPPSAAVESGQRSRRCPCARANVEARCRCAAQAARIARRAAGLGDHFVIEAMPLTR